jgi:hypothetical protein
MSRYSWQRRTAILALATAVFTSACFHTTEMAATWRAPEAQPIRFEKPIAVFVTKDGSLRRTMEDEIVAKVPHAVPSYKVLNVEDLSEKEIRGRLAERGYDGVILMQVVQVENRTTYVPGAYWYSSPYSFNGNWYSSWQSPYDPGGYYAEDKVVSIETQIYSLANDQLIWAGRSETTNPQSVRKLGHSVVKHVMHSLDKEQLR